MSDLQDLPRPRTLSSATRARQRSVLQAAISSPQAPHRRWLTPLTISIGTGALLATTGAAVIQYQGAQSATDTSEVRCYSVAEVGSDSSFKGTGAIQASTAEGPNTPPDPIEYCGALWRAGVIQAGQSQAQGPAGVHPIPPLVACTLDNGMAAVFPGDTQTCAELHLPPLAN